MVHRAGTLFFVAMGWVFCLLATAGLASAQETTSAAEDQYVDAAADGSCTNPVELVSVGPTTDNIVVPFESTGRTFRVSYTVEFVDPEDFNNLNINIEGEFGLVAYENIFESGSDSYIVTEGPESYDLVVDVEPANGATYTVTIEDCETSTGGGPGPDPSPDPPGEDPLPPGKKPPGLLDRTVPKDLLSPTGGISIFFGAGALLAASAVLFVRILRP